MVAGPGQHPGSMRSNYGLLPFKYISLEHIAMDKEERISYTASKEMVIYRIQVDLKFKL
jgi:hypothetical protein